MSDLLDIENCTMLTCCSVNMMKSGSGETKVESPQEFWSISQMIQEIYHLEGLPSFVNGRKGELQL